MKLIKRHLPAVSPADLLIPGTNRMFCALCSKARPHSEFSPGEIECQDCAARRDAAIRDELLSKDRSFDRTRSLLLLLSAGQTPHGLTEGEKRQLRNLVIDACADDEGFLRSLREDLRILEQKLRGQNEHSVPREIQQLKDRI